MKVIYQNTAEGLVQKGGKYYTIQFDGGYDFWLIFEADRDGNIKNWNEEGTAGSVQEGIDFVKRWR